MSAAPLPSESKAEPGGSTTPDQHLPLPDRSLLVLYATETGNSEDIAEELGKMAERLHFVTVVDEMNSIALKHLLAFTLVIFVTSTTGQGDMPQDASTFWKALLRKRLPPTCLASVRFTVFGLGDSSYPKFNWAARKLHRRLLQLGAREFFAPGEGDERHDDGIDSIYIPWARDLRTCLLADYPLPPPFEPIPEGVQLPPKYLLRLATDMEPLGNLTEGERDGRFLENREKNAALSHVDRPRSEMEQLDLDWDRIVSNSVPVLARRDEASERSLLDGRRVDSLDKDNILKDSPDKYLLGYPSQARPRTPPEQLLPIPGTFTATLNENVRVTPESHWQDVRFMSFYIPPGDQPEIPEIYPGATLVIYPKNFPEDVETLIDRMGWRDIADKPLEWVNESFVSDPSNLRVNRHRPMKLHARRGATLRDLFLHNFDFTAIPKRSFIGDISFYATNDRERDRLRELVKPGNTQEFYDYTSRPRRTILELLQDFPSVQIPFERVLSLFPLIRGREFSFANAAQRLGTADKPDDEGLVVEILVALVEYKTLMRKPRQGLCSRYLRNLEDGAKLQVGIKSSAGSAPPWQKEHAYRPLVAIATGTGIAPIRSLIQERHAHQSELARPPTTLLFFGCRNRDADFHFHEEWEELANFLHVIPAFSRDKIDPPDSAALDPYTSRPRGTRPEDVTTTVPSAFDHDRGRNYVQHHIRKHAKTICELMPRNPIVCVCGNSGRMPKAVRQALVDALILGEAAKTVEEAEALFARLDFWQEAW